MNSEQALSFVDKAWEETVLPSLIDYAKIPNLSPAFDSDWQAKGHMEAALTLLSEWCSENAPAGARVWTERLPGRTPVLLIDVPGTGEDRVLLYGHFDKQPEMTGWREGLGPWSPTLQGDRLYGRGTADDGYAVFSSLVALKLLQEEGVPHAGCLVLIEGCEEGGSFDLPFYLDLLGDRIGSPSLVIGLDSGCGNYEQLWGTTSLRGLISGSLSVELLREGVHSGDGSGVVASSFRVLRSLLSRLEDEATGEILPDEFRVEVPEERLADAQELARILGDATFLKYPLLEGAEPVGRDPLQLILNRTWRPALSITGAEGLPPLEIAGNVLRPRSAVQISLRIPPSLDPGPATAYLKELLEKDPPYGARVRFEPEQSAPGWNAPASAAWLKKTICAASREYFGKDAAYMGEGGTIPFMGMLGEKFPEAQFFITGLLGPESNAHGPNEFLHLPTAKRLTCAVANVLEAHQRRS